MSPADRNKILIIGGVVLVAVVVIGFFFLRGGKPSAPAETTGSFPTETAQAPVEGVEGAAPTEAPPPGEETPEAAGGEVPAEVRVGVIDMGRGVDEPSRPDALLTFEPKIPPPPPEIVIPLPATILGPLRPAQPAAVSVIGRRRVAGVMFNERPWAILEEGGDTFIVKPGDIVDGVRIAAIARSAIYVVDPEGRRWVVPLRGTGPAAEVGGGESSYLGGMPELPPAAP
ncbi:MAG: hypothetical protein JSV79_08150 [Armatimonadota bacterium]|nr:MAG: hypothetical protein JSV79_08150 [Armatimonadota bacterium]